MARTDITITQLAGNTPVEFIPTEGDAANGHRVANSRLVALRVENTGDAPCTVTVQPGDPQWGAFRAHALNGLDVTVPAGGVRLIGPLEAARFSHGPWFHIDLDQDEGVVLGALRRPGGL